MGDKATLHAPFTRAHAPWRQMLKRWKPIRISPNLRTKPSGKVDENDEVSHVGDIGPWDLFLRKRNTHTC